MAKTTDITVKGTSAKVWSRQADGFQVAQVENPDVRHLLLGINTDDLVEYVREYIAVEEIYSETELTKWAEANGYSKSND